MKKKILLTIGTLGVITSSVIAVVSCSDKKTEGETDLSPEQKAQHLKEARIRKLKEAKTFLEYKSIDSSFQNVLASSLNNLTDANVLEKVFGITNVPDKLTDIKIENTNVSGDDTTQNLSVSFTLKLQTETQAFSREIDGYKRPLTQAEKDKNYIHSLFYKKNPLEGIVVMKTDFVADVFDWIEDSANDWFWQGINAKKFYSQDFPWIKKSLGVDVPNDPRLKGFTVDYIQYDGYDPYLYLKVHLSKGNYSELVQFTVEGWENNDLNGYVYGGGNYRYPGYSS